MKNLKVKFGFFSVFIALALIFSANKFTLLSFLAATIHEAGHLIASKLFNLRICELNFGLLGARLKTSGSLCSYKQEILLCFFGPFFNLLSALAIYVYSMQFGYLSETAEFFIVSSLILGVLNLLPIRTFDGGRILEAVLSSFLSIEKVYCIINVLSFIIIFLLWGISVYFLLIYTSSLGLFIFSVSLFASLFIEGEV